MAILPRSSGSAAVRALCRTSCAEPGAHRFSELDLVDFDAPVLIFKLRVHTKRILVRYLATFWRFCQDAEFAARQRLEDTLKLSFVNLCQLLDACA